MRIVPSDVQFCALDWAVSPPNPFRVKSDLWAHKIVSLKKRYLFIGCDRFYPKAPWHCVAQQRVSFHWPQAAGQVNISLTVPRCALYYVVGSSRRDNTRVLITTISVKLTHHPEFKTMIRFSFVCKNKVSIPVIPLCFRQYVNPDFYRHQVYFGFSSLLNNIYTFQPLLKTIAF